MKRFITALTLGALVALGLMVSPAAATVTPSPSFTPNPCIQPEAVLQGAAWVLPPECQPALDLTKTVSDSAPQKGDTIQWTVTVSNTSLVPIPFVQVNDGLPIELLYVSSTQSVGTGLYDHATGDWVVGPLAAGKSAQLVITTIVHGSGAQTNCAIAAGLFPVRGDELRRVGVVFAGPKCVSETPPTASPSPGSTPTPSETPTPSTSTDTPGLPDTGA